MACLTVASGQTASLFSVLNVAQAGDNIVSSTDLYGGTVSLFTHTLSKLGIEIRYADPKDPKNFEKKLIIRPELFMGKLYQIHIYVYFQLKKFQILVENTIYL